MSNRRGPPLYMGVLEAHAIGGMLAVAVPEASVARAITLVDAFARAADKRGFKVEPIPDYSGYGDASHRRRLVVEGVPVRVRLSEGSTRTQKKRPARPTSPWLREQRYDYHPTGEFTLRVFALDEPYGPAELVLRDRSDAPLEKRLNEVMVALTEAACRVLRSRVWREERRRQEEAGRTRAIELARQREADAARDRALEQLAERWHRARLLREFIGAVEMGGAVPGPPDAPQRLSDWLRWARAHASKLDPLQLELKGRPRDL